MVHFDGDDDDVVVADAVGSNKKEQVERQMKCDNCVLAHDDMHMMVMMHAILWLVQVPCNDIPIQANNIA